MNASLPERLFQKLACVRSPSETQNGHGARLQFQRQRFDRASRHGCDRGDITAIRWMMSPFRNQFFAWLPRQKPRDRELMVEGAGISCCLRSRPPARNLKGGLGIALIGPTEICCSLRHVGDMVSLVHVVQVDWLSGLACTSAGRGCSLKF